MANLPGALEFSAEEMSLLARNPQVAEATLRTLEKRGEPKKSLDFFRHVLERHQKAQDLPPVVAALERPFAVRCGGIGMHAGRHIDIMDALGRGVVRLLKIEGESLEDRYARAVKLCGEMNRE